jgi:hypothetical protein
LQVLTSLRNARGTGRAGQPEQHPDERGAALNHRVKAGVTPVTMVGKGAKLMRRFIVNSWDAVMDNRHNPLRSGASRCTWKLDSEA